MSFWYLATPYTKFPGGREAAFDAAKVQTGLLHKAGIVVFSPIVHCHPLFEAGFAEGSDFETWRKYDHAMIGAARGLIMCKLPSWDVSHGMAEERKLCAALDKPVVDMTPGLVPFLPVTL